MKPSLAAKKRLLGISLFLFFLFSLLIVQFFKIQIIEGDKWAKAAAKQHQLVVVEPFKRGLFYSNAAVKPAHPETPQPFVVDVPLFDLYADPSTIPPAMHQEIIATLSSLLQLDAPKASHLRVQLEKKARCRKLIPYLEQEKREAIEHWWFSFARKKKIPRNALFFLKEYKRCYPFAALLGPVLHTLRTEKDPQTHQPVPTGGLELTYDAWLRGKEGKRLILRSPRHPLETEKILSAPEDGADVYLTINHTLQAIAEEEIEKAVKNAHAKCGWAILMEPHTGEIWALAQYPGFNPQDYSRYFNDVHLAEQTKVKAITDPFEPGSTMKPLSMAIALKANRERQKEGKPPLFSPGEKLATDQGIFPGRSKPIHDTRRHRFLNMPMAVQKSSNIYVARIIQRVVDTMGAEWYRQALQNIFGFGVKTGIELASESPGMLPMPGKKHPNGRMEWSTPTPFSIAFGHNILANSMQVARAYAILANGGYGVQPHLVRKVVRKNREGEIETILDNTVKERGQSPPLLEPEIVQEVVAAMKFTTKPGGSAPKADIWGYTEAGKTSTSEKIVNGVYSKKDHISTFVGFAPVQSPRFVLFIAIDDPEHKYIPGVGKNQLGGTCAAPAFREIGTRVLEYLGAEPDDPYGRASNDPRRRAEKADWAQEIKALKELYTQWNPSH